MLNRIRENILPLTVALAFLMELIDATVLATAIPVVARDLGVPVLSLKMAMATYLISLAALVPISGWIADRFGARRIFVLAMAIFLVASLLCAVQTTLTGLVLARALQGVGAAMMSPVGRLIVLRNTEKSEMTRAMVYVIMPALIGPAIGPFVGATVTTFFGWRAIFLMNLPFGALAIWLTFRNMPKEGPTEAKPFDLPGFLLSALGLAAAMTGFSALGEHILPWQLAAALSLGGLGLLAAYWVHAGKRRDPLLDPRLFRHRTFDVSVTGGLIFRLSNGAISLLLPLFFQLGLGATVMLSGALTGLNAVGAVAMRGLAPRMLDRFGFKWVMVSAALLRGITIFGFATVTSLTDWQLVPLLLIGGAAQSVVFTAVNSIAFADLEGHEMSAGTAFTAMSRQVSLALGIALAGVVLELTAGAAATTAGTEMMPVGAFLASFLIAGLTGPLSALYFLRLRPGDADALRRKRRPVEGIGSSREPYRPPQPAPSQPTCPGAIRPARRDAAE
ncbi:MFS transporter [Thioclava atlantica]|uniref:Multidrug efflux protein n=1 Tax=Thioclava atlantica TaxID=1317124 RepID=A0A085TX74_9RHOB|nr:MFS transporter [Thioclava atlantica]KFE35321.1 multidrug efflux protein [Thioclava atlantica]